MNFESNFLRSAVRAQMTLVGPLARVGADVPLQICASHEVLAAVGAQHEALWRHYRRPAATTSTTTAGCRKDSPGHRSVVSGCWGEGRGVPWSLKKKEERQALLSGQSVVRKNAHIPKLLLYNWYEKIQFFSLFTLERNVNTNTHTKSKLNRMFFLAIIIQYMFSYPHWIMA